MLEDLGRIPTAFDWWSNLAVQPWMLKAGRRSRALGPAEADNVSGAPPYTLAGRSITGRVTAAGDEVPAAPCLFCGTTIRHVNDGGVGWLLGAVIAGRAEQFLGSWLDARADAPTPFVASKWGYTYTAEDPAVDADEVKTHDLPTLERQWAETRALLGDRLRLYQVHSLTVDSPLWDDDALLHRLAELRDAGTALGFSTSGPRQADAVRRGVALQVAVARPAWFKAVVLYSPVASEAPAEYDRWVQRSERPLLVAAVLFLALIVVQALTPDRPRASWPSAPARSATSCAATTAGPTPRTAPCSTRATSRPASTRAASGSGRSTSGSSPGWCSSAWPRRRRPTSTR